MPVNDFKWVEGISEFDKSFIKSYNEESDERYFLEFDGQYPEIMKIEKVEKLLATLQALNHELVL